MIESRNREYQAKIEAAFFQAIIDVGKIPGGNVTAVLSGEVAMACLNVTALVIASSKLTSSATKTREFCDQVAKQLRKKIEEAKELAEQGEMNWMQVIHAEDR